MNDFVLGAPTAQATFPAELRPQDVVALQAARIRELEQDVQAKTVAASTIANVASCLVRMYGQGDRVVVPAELSERMRGSQLTVAELNGDIEVRAREVEKPAPVAFEDRRD